MKKRNQKITVAAIAVPVLAAGSVAIGAAYQNANHFQPSDEDQEMQKNQIVFSDDQNLSGEDQNQNRDNSEMIQKDQNAKDQTGNKNQNIADYLFQQQLEDNVSPTGRVLMTSGAGGGQSSASSGTSAVGDNMYNLTGDGSGADLVIGGRVPIDLIGGNPTENGGQGNQNNQSSQDNQGNSSNSDSDNRPGDNSNTDPTPNPTPNPTPTTPTRPSATAKDPSTGKLLPDVDDGIINKPYDESDEWNDDLTRVIIIPGYETSEGVALYKGQSEVDQEMIYNSLYTYVWGDDGVRYVWDADAFGKYIKIDRISFDDGQTWITDFPITIPNDAMTTDMLIEVSYRLMMSSSWTVRDIEYPLKESRVFVLSDKITEDNAVIDTDKILNYDQFPDVGSLMNLFYYQKRFFGDERLTELFPGWEEDGQLLPWYYKATLGRHILEPADMVPLSDAYTVKIVHQWMSDDYEVGFQYDNLSYLQTLTDFDSSAIHNMTDGRMLDWLFYNELEVPKYVQAVVLDESKETREVDYLKLPDTVLYVDDTGSSLHVNYGYIVDENNHNYTATEDGLLCNKDETEIAAIPYQRTSLTVPEKVKKVQISADNQLEELMISGESLEELPDITYKNLKNCKIVVDDDLLEPFLLSKYADMAEGEGNCVAAKSNPDITYTITNQLIINNLGQVCKVLQNGSTTLALPDVATQINEGALDERPDIETLILPKSGQKVTLEKDCLKNSGITRIRCYSKKQYDAVEEELEQTGTAYEIEVELIGTSVEGYSYSVTEEDGITEVTLLDIPSDLKNFDGTLTADDGTLLDITEIADRAFADSKELEWVTLPVSVEEIGYQAFQNCSKLQGVMIETTGVITIGDEAFDKCDSLRFVASNAFYGIMENNYDPIISDARAEAISYCYFFVPTGSYGYTEHCISFSEESGVYGYDMVDIGDGNQMLFGTNITGEPWLGLRSGSQVSDQVKLPTTAVELFYYAMADTTSPSGSYSVNWSELPDCKYLDTGCFQGSSLGGKVTLGDNCMLGDYALADCSKITDIVLPGDEISIQTACFWNCSSLKSVEFGGFSEYSGLPPDVFEDCNELRDVTFLSATPTSILLYGSIGYRFNFTWTQEEETANLRIHIPEGSVDAYIKEWRYPMCGYISYDTQPAYMQLRNDVMWDLIDWDTWAFPTDEEIENKIEEKMLEVENRLRTMFGEKQVSEPTELYQYRESGGFGTLSRVPTYLKEVRLDPETLDFSPQWYLDYIGNGAFSRAKNLQKVTILNNLIGIYSGAFEGVESDTLTLEFEGAQPTNLVTDTEGEMFSFGVDDSKVNIVIPEGAQAAYRKLWQYQLAGYRNEAAMRESITAQLTDVETGQAPTEEEVNAVMEQYLTQTRERLDILLGEESVQTEEEQQP